MIYKVAQASGSCAAASFPMPSDRKACMNPLSLCAGHAQTVTFCIIAGCCAKDQCECTMRHSPPIKR